MLDEIGGLTVRGWGGKDPIIFLTRGGGVRKRAGKQKNEGHVD